MIKNVKELELPTLPPQAGYASQRSLSREQSDSEYASQWFVCECEWSTLGVQI